MTAEQIDWRAKQPSQTACFSEDLWSLRHYLRAQSQVHHTIGRLEERGEERGSARQAFLKGRESAVVNQTTIGTVSKEYRREISERRGEVHMGFSELIDTQSSGAV